MAKKLFDTALIKKWDLYPLPLNPGSFVTNRMQWEWQCVISQARLKPFGSLGMLTLGEASYCARSLTTLGPSGWKSQHDGQVRYSS